MTIQVEHVTKTVQGKVLLKDFNLEISSDTSYMLTDHTIDSSNETLAGNSSAAAGTATRAHAASENAAAVRWSSEEHETDAAAKTELFRIILGLDQPDEGRVRLLGDYKYSSVNAGVVFREDRLAEDFSAAVNCAMVNRKLSERIAAEELDKLLAPGRSSLPVRELTPEERRLVCIVRATIIPSDVILMDSPFAGLSPDNRRKAIAYIKEVKASTPVVLAVDNTEGLGWCKTVDIHTGIPLSM